MRLLVVVVVWTFPAAAQDLNTDHFRPSFAERGYLSRGELAPTSGVRLGVAISAERAPLVVRGSQGLEEVIDLRGALTVGAWAAARLGLSLDASLSLFASAAGGGAWSLRGELPLAAVGELRARATYAPRTFR